MFPEWSIKPGMLCSGIGRVVFDTKYMSDMNCFNSLVPGIANVLFTAVLSTTIHDGDKVGKALYLSAYV